MREPLEPLPRLAASVSERFIHSGLAGANLFDAAEAERISPILYYGFLHDGWPEGLPERERARFKRAYYASAGQNVELLAALGDVSSILAAGGIPCIAFKGADLAKRLYPNVALRPMGDVDVYVAPKDAESAETLLARAGYLPWTPDMTRGLSRRIRHARLYVGGPAAIDLHWSLVGHADDARAPERDWIDRHTRRSGESWQCLSETAHLLYLAAHMKLQHYDEEIPLLWLIDFYRLAACGAIQWDELLEDAARFGWRDAVSACAYDVRQRLGVELPEELRRVAAEPTRTLHAPGARNAPERVVNELRTLGWSGRLALVRAYVLPSTEYVRFRYPPPNWLPRWAWPLGYLKRWWRLLSRGAAIALGWLGSGRRARPLLAPRETC